VVGTWFMMEYSLRMRSSWSGRRRPLGTTFTATTLPLRRSCIKNWMSGEIHRLTIECVTERKKGEKM
jgi:hypothetical protein